MFDSDRMTHQLLRDIIAQLDILLYYASRAKSAKLTLEGANMPATIVVGGNGAQAAFVEWDGPNGTGNKVSPVGNVLFSSDNAAVATVDSTGKVTAVAAGTCNISGLDQGNNLTASDSLTVTAAGPGPAVSATLTLQAL
jgi:hypothetical protein